LTLSCGSSASGVEFDKVLAVAERDLAAVPVLAAPFAVPDLVELPVAVRRDLPSAMIIAPL
jgi:hypothetical protein